MWVPRSAISRKSYKRNTDLITQGLGFRAFLGIQTECGSHDFGLQLHLDTRLQEI